jgi:hypothetical protein
MVALTVSTIHPPSRGKIMNLNRFLYLFQASSTHLRGTVTNYVMVFTVTAVDIMGKQLTMGQMWHYIITNVFKTFEIAKTVFVFFNKQLL